MVYLCPRCKGDAGKFCLVCGGKGVYEPLGGPGERQWREEVLQLHLQLDVARADVETVKQKYINAVQALPEDLQRAPGTLADAVRALAEREDRLQTTLNMVRAVADDTEGEGGTETAALGTIIEMIDATEECKDGVQINLYDSINTVDK